VPCVGETLARFSVFVGIVLADKKKIIIIYIYRKYIIYNIICVCINIYVYVYVRIYNVCMCIYILDLDSYSYIPIK